MQLLKTRWPKTLEDIYSGRPIKIPDNNLLGIRSYVIIDVRPPQKGEFYISSRGTIKYAHNSTKNVAMTRVIVRRLP
jgi:hypothetical protein